jgi:hypothetical protein
MTTANEKPWGELQRQGEGRNHYWCPAGGRVEFTLDAVVAWGAMRNYGRAQKFTLARLSDGRVVYVPKSKQSKEVAREIERRTKGLDVASPAVTRSSLQNVAWKEAK